MHQHTQQKLKGLSAQRDQCELVQTQLSRCLNYAEGSLKTNSEGEILALKIPVVNQIEQIAAEFKPDILTPGQEADIQLLTGDTLDLEMSCQGFAEIVSGHCTKSYATGKGLKTATVRDLKGATVTLHTRDKDDGECNALVKAHCTESYATGYSLKPAIVRDLKGATVTLHTRDKDDGECNAQVTAHCAKSYATGYGLKTATVGEGATVTLHARDKDNSECDVLVRDINASLVCTGDSTTVKCDVKREGKSTCTVSYRPITRGRHKLYLEINGKIVKGNPHTVFVEPNLQRLGNPVKVIRGLNEPCGVTTDSKGRNIVTECSGHHVSIFSPE